MGFYGGADNYYTYSYIGLPSTNFSFDYLECNGTESHLSDCFHAENTTCYDYEGVWIYCNTKTTIGNIYYSFKEKFYSSRFMNDWQTPVEGYNNAGIHV